jgi:phosphoserine phosphatase
MRLALFDLDNTLLTGDSDYEWGQFLVDHGVLEREAYEAQNRAYYEQYVAGTLDIHEYLGFALRPLAEHTAEQLARWHTEFMRLRIVPMITPAARDLVKRHAGAGDHGA